MHGKKTWHTCLNSSSQFHLDTTWTSYGHWNNLECLKCFFRINQYPFRTEFQFFGKTLSIYDEGSGIRSAHAILILHRIAIFLHSNPMKIEIIEFPFRQTCVGYFRARFHTSIRGLRGGLVLRVRFFLRWWNCMSISKMVSVPPSWCIFLHSWNTFRHRLCHTWCERRIVGNSYNKKYRK